MLVDIAAPFVPSIGEDKMLTTIPKGQALEVLEGREPYTTLPDPVVSAVELLVVTTHLNFCGGVTE